MSALGGIYNFDGTPIDEEMLASLGEALSDRGLDGGRELKLGSVGMTYRAFHTNRESRLEWQPLLSANGRILAWDGRLDNREELLKLLHSEVQGYQTDVAIVMASYQKWGIDFLPRLIGDFALSLWDPISRVLLLARDPVGARMLYYHKTENSICWSSEIGPLLNVVKGKLEINDEYIAGFLAREPEPELTPYKGICAVPPGQVVAACNERLRIQRFWGLDPSYEIRYKNDEDYEEHFRQLFREAVRCRLRTDGPAWAELSGGLDSSSIVCMADQIISSGETQATELETVSYVYDESPRSDETKFIGYVEDHRGKTGHHLQETRYRVLATFADESSIVIPNPVHGFTEYHRGLCEEMRANSARVLLTGQGGDQVLCSSPNPSPLLSDLLVQYKLWDLHRSLQIWSRVLKKPYLELLWQNTLCRVLPDWAQALYRDRKLPAWFNKKFAARMNLHERMFGSSADPFGFRLPSERDQALGFLSVVKHISAGYRQERANIEFRYPYLHRPLVEFLQAIPFEQRVRPGETRSLMRRALQGLLPERIAMRKGKRSPTEAILRAVSREWPRLQITFANPRVCAYGYIDHDALLVALDRARHGCELSAAGMIKTISLEFWLRALECRAFMAERSIAVLDGNTFQQTTMARAKTTFVATP